MSNKWEDGCLIDPQYRFIGNVPVNCGNWKQVLPGTGTNRGDEWREIYFQEATFNWGWLPPNSYGRFIIEFKNMNREAGFRGEAVEFQLAYVKQPRYITKTEHFIHIEGAYFKETKFKQWELYETDFFPLPTYQGPILLYLMCRSELEAVPAVAMWNLALFEKMEPFEVRTL